jgi:hypothetical protein
MNSRALKGLVLAAGSVAAAVGAGGAAGAAVSASAPTAAQVVQHKADTTAFKMVRSSGAVADKCLYGAYAKVYITPIEGAEKMVVKAYHLPPKTEFDFFVTQVPDAPFGLSWYQGDIETNKYGTGYATFIGRFNEETFTVAPGSTAAPVVHSSPIPDAPSNPATRPVHQYHLGLWFNSPEDAQKAGCSPAVTPFNGEHDAGVQALSTRQFPAQAGPLSQIES